MEASVGYVLKRESVRGILSQRESLELGWDERGKNQEKGDSSAEDKVPCTRLTQHRRSPNNVELFWVQAMIRFLRCRSSFVAPAHNQVQAARQRAAAAAGQQRRALESGLSPTARARLVLTCLPQGRLNKRQHRLLTSKTSLLRFRVIRHDRLDRSVAPLAPRSRIRNVLKPPVHRTACGA